MFIGTAGWSVPPRYAASFPKTGSHLERYGDRLNAAEINSSFYRSHQRKTYIRWADSVPPQFRFSVKLPRAITHEHRLKNCSGLIARFLEEVGGLGNKLDVVLAQLPPSLTYDDKSAQEFFRRLRSGRTRIACEPRHASWFTAKADNTLANLQVVRVAADPPRASGDGEPGGWRGYAYWRLHGSPKIYYSDYDTKRLKILASRIRPGDWCVFDNTAASAALGNALTLKGFTDA